MFIKSLRLNNYRNIEESFIVFYNGINIIYGNNAQGKTNIAESIFLCTTGRSYRTRIEKELICFGEKSANVKVSYNKRGYDDSIEIVLINGEKKGIAVNGRPLKRTGELFGELQTVIFSPEDLSIVNESPSERRRFMDMQICQINKVYYYNLNMYYKVLRQRNALLKQKDISNYRDNIAAWDVQLVIHGKEILKTRRWFIDSLNPIAERIHKVLSNECESLIVEYKANTDIDTYEEKLKRSIERDIMYGSTSIGPHKDDIAFLINGREAKIYGSQGQKRTAALSCRLAEIDIIQNETGDSPVLLLDDVFSELDSVRQEMLLEYISKIQTIITATGMDHLVGNIKTRAKVFYIECGKIKEVPDEQR